MINVSQDILRTLCYVRDCNTSRQRQQQLLLQETNHRHHRSSSDHQHLQEPMSPRQSIARGQKRKQEEQQQRGVSRKKKVCYLKFQRSWRLAYLHYFFSTVTTRPGHVLPPVQRHRLCQVAVRARRAPDALQRLRPVVR